jgi:hypothetical protein
VTRERERERGGAEVMQDEGDEEDEEEEEKRGKTRLEVYF